MTAREPANTEQSIDEVRTARVAAEAVVDGIKDEDLRTSAFEIAFRHFLTSNAAATKTPRAPRRRRPQRGTAAPAEDGTTHRRRGRSARNGQQTLVRELIDDGYFDSPREISEVLAELRQRGHVFKHDDLGTPLRRLTQARELRRYEAKDGDGPARWKYQRWR